MPVLGYCATSGPRGLAFAAGLGDADEIAVGIGTGDGLGGADGVVDLQFVAHGAELVEDGGFEIITWADPERRIASIPRIAARAA